MSRHARSRAARYGSLNPHKPDMDRPERAPDPKAPKGRAPRIRDEPKPPPDQV